MTDQNPVPPDEEPLKRFRRMMESGEESSSAGSEHPGGPGVPSDSESTPAEPEVPAEGESSADSPVPSAGRYAAEEQPAPAPEVPASPAEETTPAAVSDTKPHLPEPSVAQTLPPAPPPMGEPQRKAPPAVGREGIPLPRRVDEIDMHATRVSPAAYRPAPTPQRAIPRPAAPPPLPPRAKPALSPPKTKTGQAIGCALRMALLGVFAVLVITFLAGSYAFYEYNNIRRQLPSVEDLRNRASFFETTRIFDRNGNLLYELTDPNAGRRTYVTLEKISPYLVAATIATEDQSYYSHPGFDWLAIVRAFWQNLQSGETVSGASTITQQVARTLLLSPEERSERSYIRKVREALLAAEITRRYSKDEILELYLNENNYGNRAYGIEAGAETYFGTTAAQLTLAQGSFLAGLPQAPAVYDIYNNPDATHLRHQQVLRLMYEASAEQGCIYVSNSSERVCVDIPTAQAAYAEIENYSFRAPEILMRYPHWVNYVIQILETQYDAQTIYRSGFSVYTTLDPGLQDTAEEIVERQVAALADKNARNGALVAIRPATGEILAMVGSANFYDESIDGQVNMALSPTRQPGSSIKPITYLAAFERGWTPATLIWDVPSEFPPSGIPGDPSPPYVPVNYDGRFHGPVTVRTALANSYNIPAVKTLQFVGIYDNPEIPGEDGMVAMARRLGITSLTGNQYGLSLTLGGGELSLFELTGAYSVMANGGRRMPPVAITRILDHTGQVVYEYTPPAGDQVIRPEHAYLITSILSDNEARAPMFGTGSVLALPFQAAAKTGTTNDFRDNWTLGYTADIAVGVWIGNADYTPMVNTTGLTGAAPIWAEFMQAAVQQLTGGNPTPFFRPAGIVDRVICAVSGSEPSPWCPSQRSEIFAADQPPLPSNQDLWSKVVFDSWTGLRASAACLDYTKEEFALNVTDVWALAWIQNDAAGKEWASQNGFSDPILFVPPRECRADDPRPFLAINSPGEGQTVTFTPLDIFGTAYATANFRDYTLEYGLGDNPTEWIALASNTQPLNPPDRIIAWQMENVPPGVVTLRLTMNSIFNTSVEVRVHFINQAATPTPTITPTPTATPTFLPTVTPMPSFTPTPTIGPTVTPGPTEPIPTP